MSEAMVSLLDLVHPKIEIGACLICLIGGLSGSSRTAAARSCSSRTFLDTWDRPCTPCKPQASTRSSLGSRAAISGID